jgi:hypothetical protein
MLAAVLSVQPAWRRDIVKGKYSVCSSQESLCSIKLPDFPGDALMGK